MKRSHKRILIILVLLLAAVFLSSCGGVQVVENPVTGVSESVYTGGIFEVLAAPLRALIVFFNDKLLEPIGVIYSWGWAIILVAIVVRGALMPLSLKQMRSMRDAQAKTKALQPELDRLKKKYGKDKQRYQQEQMKLYQEHGITQAQMAGCLPTLIQMPILFAFYYAILGLAADVGVPTSGSIQGQPWYFIPDISFPTYHLGLSWLTEGLSVHRYQWFPPVFDQSRSLALSRITDPPGDHPVLHGQNQPELLNHRWAMVTATLLPA